MYLYKSSEPFGSQVVTPRSGTSAAKNIAAYHRAVETLTAAEDALASATTDKARDKATANVTTAREAVARTAVKAKGAVKFPVPDGATVSRFIVDADTAEAYAVASESEREAIHATLGEPVVTESAVHPSILATDGMRAAIASAAQNAGTTPGALMLARLADGILILPSTAKGASAKSARKSADEKAAEAVAALFG